MTSKRKRFLFTQEFIYNPPKTTEILSLFHSQMVKKYEKESKSVIIPNRKTKNYPKKKIPIIDLHDYNPKKFHSDTLLIDQYKKSPLKFQILKNILNKSNLNNIKDLVLPEVKNTFNKGVINKKFLETSTKLKIKRVTNEILYSNYSSPKFNEIRGNYLIDKEVNRNKKILKRATVTNKTIQTQDEIEESYDDVMFGDLKLIRLKKIIKTFLGAKDSKLNQLKFKRDEFFNKKENRVNFLYDIFQLPNFKNNFINYYNMEKLHHFSNIISPGINRYLSVLRFNIQKKKDNDVLLQKLKDCKMEDNIDKIKFIHDRENDEDNFDKINFFLARKNDEDKFDKMNFLRDKDNDEDKLLYDLNLFFVHKYNKYENVKFASNKIFEILNKPGSKRINIKQNE